MSDFHDDYVDGDINTIDDESDSAERAATATTVLAYIAEALADDPAAVTVDVDERQGKVILSLRVGPGDMGRIIGRRGRTAQAIRVLVGAAGARDGVTTSVDIVD